VVRNIYLRTFTFSIFALNIIKTPKTKNLPTPDLNFANSPANSPGRNKQVSQVKTCLINGKKERHLKDRVIEKIKEKNCEL